MHTKLIGPHEELRYTGRASKYLSDKKHKRHKGIDFPDTAFLGLTTEKTLVEDCGAAWAGKRKANRCGRGRKPEAKSLWPMQRMADNSELSEKERAGLVAKVAKALGPGARAQINFHVPNEKKRRATGVPGLEINALCASQRQIGPFHIPLRHNRRSLRRELMRGADLMEEEINATRTQQERIRTMPEVLKERRTEQAIAKQLACREEKEVAFHRPNGTIHTGPYILLNSIGAVKQALADAGYVVEEMKRKPALAEPGQQDHLVWIWHWDWMRRVNQEQEEKRRKTEKADREAARQRHSRIQIDLLRITLEARALFLGRIAAMKQQREERLRPEIERREEVRRAVLEAGPDKLATLPQGLIHRAERNVITPITMANATSVLRSLGCTVRDDEPEKNRIALRTESGSDVVIYRDHLLISLQVAPARRHFAAVTFFFETDPAGESVRLPATGTSQLNPFHPIWTKYHRSLEDHSRQELWSMAYEDVVSRHSNRELTALEKAVYFYRFLVQERISHEEALFMTAIHYKGCNRPWGHFLRAFSSRLLKHGAELVNIPYRSASEPFAKLAPVSPIIPRSEVARAPVQPPTVAMAAQQTEASPRNLPRLNANAEPTRAQDPAQVTRPTTDHNLVTIEPGTKSKSATSPASMHLGQSSALGAQHSSSEHVMQQQHEPSARRPEAPVPRELAPKENYTAGQQQQPKPLPVDEPEQGEKLRRRRKLKEQPPRDQEPEAPGR